MVIKGFKFGMLLQIAVGPICLFVFQTAVAYGFTSAMSGVIGVTLIDALYILAAICGLGTLLQHYKNFKKTIQYFGAIVLIGFGVSTILGIFGISVVPSVNFLSKQSATSIFLKALILTLSNPLTIVFWAGVFSTKIVEEQINKSDMYLFGIGAVLSTIIFLTLVSAIGDFVNVFLPYALLNILNALVGFVLIIFGIKTGLKKPSSN